MKILDCEIGERHYEEEQFFKECQDLEIEEEAVEKITPDKAMAHRLARAFNTLGYLKPESLTSYHKRAAFVAALRAVGINYKIDYTQVWGPRIFINDKYGQWIDLSADSKAA